MPDGDGPRTRRFQGEGLGDLGFFGAALRRFKLVRRASARRASLSAGAPDVDAALPRRSSALLMGTDDRLCKSRQARSWRARRDALRPAPQAAGSTRICLRRYSSGVERSLGKGEVECSIHSSGTISFPVLPHVRSPGSSPELWLGAMSAPSAFINRTRPSLGYCRVELSMSSPACGGGVGEAGGGRLLGRSSPTLRMRLALAGPSGAGGHFKPTHRLFSSTIRAPKDDRLRRLEALGPSLFMKAKPRCAEKRSCQSDKGYTKAGTDRAWKVKGGRQPRIIAN